MATQNPQNQDILSRDIDPHPPTDFLEINVLSREDMALVKNQALDHPAEHPDIHCGEAEREVQPMSRR